MDRPWRMYQRSRAPDRSFDPDESLYLRVEDKGYNEDVIPLEALSLAILKENFRLPDQSANRGAYGKPVDVLFPNFTDWGVMRFPHRVAGVVLPHKVTQKKKVENIEFRFQPTHDPKHNNYAHCEIVVFRNGERVSHDDRNKIAPNIKLSYRERIARRATIVRLPSPSERLSWLKRRMGRM